MIVRLPGLNLALGVLCGLMFTCVVPDISRGYSYRFRHIFNSFDRTIIYPGEMGYSNSKRLIFQLSSGLSEARKYGQMIIERVFESLFIQLKLLKFHGLLFHKTTPLSCLLRKRFFGVT